MDISNSFEILYSLTDGKVVFNDAFLTKRLDQCAQCSSHHYTVLLRCAVGVWKPPPC